jgi:hypothetical protein
LAICRSAKFQNLSTNIVKINDDDPDLVFTEPTEYIATDRIKAEYESLFGAMVAALKSPNECVGIRISGCFGSGKSSFAKNLGYVPANREVLGVPARSLTGSASGMILPLGVPLELRAVIVHIPQRTRAVPVSLVVEVLGRRVAVLAASCHCLGLHSLAELHHCDKAVAAGTIPLLRVRVGARPE